MDDWPAWHGGCLALIGPEGSGKTHLALEWARTKRTPPCSSTARIDIASAYGGPVLVEDADRAHPDTLFHLINMAGPSGGLLLTARASPRSATGRRSSTTCAPA